MKARPANAEAPRGGRMEGAWKTVEPGRLDRDDHGHGVQLPISSPRSAAAITPSPFRSPRVPAEMLQKKAVGSGVPRDRLESSVITRRLAGD